MRNLRLLKRKQIGLLFLSLMLTSLTYAATFTATTSGNFSSTATWSGGVVPSKIVLTDQIIIASGVTVNLDSSLTFNGVLSELDVQGTLSTNNNSSLTLNIGKLTGVGNIALNTITVNEGSAFSFTGALTVATLNVKSGFQTSANILVTQTLNLISGTISFISGGILNLNNNGAIIISGGVLANGIGGTVNLSGNYNVTYTGNSSMAGIELKGSGLQNVTVDLNSSSKVTLTSDLAVNGTLTLTNGTLFLAGYNLTIKGMVTASGNGTVSSTTASSINISTVGGTTGIITFSANSAVNNLTLKIGSNNKANIGGTLTVNGNLQLDSGVLNLSDANLTINGTVRGSGMLYGNIASNLSISTSGGLAKALGFSAGGQLLNNLTITVGNGNSASLGSELTVNGTLALNGGSNLNLNGHALTLAANSNINGSGSLVVNSSSDLTIHSTGGISSLGIEGVIGDLIINSDVTLSEDLSVGGTLTLLSGTLILNNNNLAILGNVALAGTGTISSTSKSDISIITSTSVQGSIRFAPLANSVSDLKIGVGNNGSVSIATEMNIFDSLQFSGGKLNIGSYGLTLGTTASITGAGNNSYIITANGGFVQMQLLSGASASTNFPVGTTAHFAPANARLNAGSTSGKVKVGVVSDVMANGTAGIDISGTEPVVDATWNVSSDITSNLNMNLQVMWAAAMEVNGFNRTAAYVSHYVNGSWDTKVTAAATLETNGMYSLQSSGITSLSPFAVFDQNTSSVNQLKSDIAIEISPNPTVENIRIQRPDGSSEPLNIVIYNSQGQMMGTYILSEVSTTISTLNLLNGSYFIRFYNDQMNITKPFVKM
jgi:filamentous hemagglutinin